MKKMYFLFIFLGMIIINSSFVKADELGIYGITLDKNLYEILDNALEKDMKIIVLSDKIDKEYLSRLEAIVPDGENLDNIIEIITDPKTITRSIGGSFERVPVLNKEGSNINPCGLYTFLNGYFEADGHEEFFKFLDDYTLKFIPVELIKYDEARIGILFYSTNDEEFYPLFFYVSPINRDIAEAMLDVIKTRTSGAEKIEVMNNILYIKDDIYVLRHDYTFIFYNINKLMNIIEEEKNIFKDLEERIKKVLKNEADIKLKSLQKNM